MTIEYQDRTHASGIFTPVTYDLMLKKQNNNFAVLEAIANVVVVTASGTYIGYTAIQKLGFWGQTPVVQPTTAIVPGPHTDNGGNAVKEFSTWENYTIGQVIRALRLTGILA